MTLSFLSQSSKLNSSSNRSKAFLKEAILYFNSASQHAEAGDLDAAACSILKALDQERRADGVGPQVLRLIKMTG